MVTWLQEYVSTTVHKALGALDRIGSIKTGKYADFVITNADYTEKRVFIGGMEI